MRARIERANAPPDTWRDTVAPLLSRPFVGDGDIPALVWTIHALGADEGKLQSSIGTKRKQSSGKSRSITCCDGTEILHQFQLGRWYQGALDCLDPQGGRA